MTPSTPRSARWAPRARGRRGLAVALACAALTASACSAGAPEDDGGSRSPSAQPSPADPAAPSPSSGATTGPDGTASETAEVHPVTTVVITDDAAVADAGAGAAGTWPALLAAGMDAASPLQVTTAGARGAGFTPGSGPAFSDLVAQSVGSTTQLVILFDSQLDTADAAALREGAEAAFRAVEEAAPDAMALLVVPASTATQGVRLDEAARAAVRGSAATAELQVVVVDPVAEGWPADPSQPDVAERLRPHVAPLAEVLARSGAFE